jgi:hypothetical protein
MLEYYTELEGAVIQWLQSQAARDKQEALKALDSFLQNERHPGAVSSLADCEYATAFYETHKDDIWDIVSDYAEDDGLRVFAFLDRCHLGDIRTRLGAEQALAWLGFKLAADRIRARLQNQLAMERAPKGA